MGRFGFEVVLPEEGGCVGGVEVEWEEVAEEGESEQREEEVVG